MQTSAEEFILIGVLFAIVVAVIIFLEFSASFSAALFIGPNQNNLCENQFTAAQYGWPNRYEGTALFRSYLTDCCYNQQTAKSTCITHWCYYNYSGNQNAALNCISNPPPGVLAACSNLSPSNTAALESCDKSTIVADNATQIQSCDISNPQCIPGDSKYCAPCLGQ